MPPRWTFITSHGSTLVLIAKHKDITAREIAASLALAERSVLRIIKELAVAGYIRKTKVGRKNHYEILLDRPMRRPEMHHVQVGELIRLLDTAPKPVPKFPAAEEGNVTVLQSQEAAT